MKFLLLVAFVGICAAATYRGRNVVFNSDYDAVVNGLVHGNYYSFNRQPGQKYIDIVINGVDTPARKIQINPYTCQVINLEGFQGLPTQYTQQGEVFPQGVNYYYFFDILRNYQGYLDNYRYGQFLKDVQTGVQQGQVCQVVYQLLNYLDRVIDEDFVQKYFQYFPVQQQQVSNVVGQHYPSQNTLGGYYGNQYGLYSWLNRYLNQYYNQGQNDVSNYGYFPYNYQYYPYNYQQQYPHQYQSYPYNYQQQYQNQYQSYPYYNNKYYGNGYYGYQPYYGQQQQQDYYGYQPYYGKQQTVDYQYNSVYPYGTGRSYFLNYLLGKQYQGNSNYYNNYYNKDQGYSQYPQDFYGQGYGRNYVQSPIYAY